MFIRKTKKTYQKLNLKNNNMCKSEAPIWRHHDVAYIFELTPETSFAIGLYSNREMTLEIWYHWRGINNKHQTCADVIKGGWRSRMFYIREHSQKKSTSLYYVATIGYISLIAQSENDRRWEGSPQLKNIQCWRSLL